MVDKGGFCMNFKERWLLEDKKCETCGQVTERVRGITKQNIKRLLIPRFDVNELLITFMLIMIIVLAYSYMDETKQCREWLKPMQEGKDACLQVCNYRCALIEGIPTTTDRQDNFSLAMKELNETIFNLK
jgi:hypothetical protein